MVITSLTYRAYGEKGSQTQMLKPGIYVAESGAHYLDYYKITMEFKESKKSYIFRLVELKSRYSADHIKMLFKNSERAVISKSKGGHAMRVWSDEDFTIYPCQAGIPYWFQRVQEAT